MPEALFNKLYDATSGVSATPVAEIRRRARRRTHRNRLVAVAAVGLAVLAGYGAVTLPQARSSGPPLAPGASPSPSGSSPVPVEPSPSPSLSPTGAATGSSSATTPGGRTLTGVPVGAMLQPADLGRNWTVNDDPESGSGDWHFEAIIGYCPAQSGFGGAPQGRDRRARVARPASDPAGGLVQEVKLYRAGGAVQAFDYYRAAAIRCARHVSRLGDVEITVSIVQEGFAGDRSMIVRSRSEEGEGVWVFVVEGHLLTQFTAPGDSVSAGRDLAVKAARRMCAELGSC